MSWVQLKIIMTVTNIFPRKEKVLTEDFVNFNNFFPIATVEMDEGGRIVPIHIIYTFFEGSNADKEYFSEGEYGGNFSFEIIGNLCQPTFKKDALKINDDYLEFLNEAMEKYRSADRWHAQLNFLIKPEWWQGDDTPITDTGEPLKFICQLDLAEIVDDDCRMFIFYNNKNNKIRNVYQRD